MKMKMNSDTREEDEREEKEGKRERERPKRTGRQTGTELGGKEKSSRPRECPTRRRWREKKTGEIKGKKGQQWEEGKKKRRRKEEAGCH